eukprot:jgi/Mesvir1/3525/Mv11998-RA.1
MPNPGWSKFLKPYAVHVLTNRQFISVHVIHRPTSRIISSASTSEKALREALPSLNDLMAAVKIGELIALRTKAAGVESVYVDKREFEALEVRAAAILRTATDHGLRLVWRTAEDGRHLWRDASKRKPPNMA